MIACIYVHFNLKRFGGKFETNNDFQYITEEWWLIDENEDEEKWMKKEGTKGVEW